ncbi:MAG TPA: glycosyl hydrolase [Cytophagaceae bacterium]|nr:glycosyl hydrolase [Cytophagaceae bacterium]
MRKSFLIFVLISLTIGVRAQTISPKRGIAGDMLDANDLATVKGHLTWYYNWANEPNNTVIGTYQNSIEFCPMLWNGSWNGPALTTYLSAHPDVKYLLTFNEPNRTDQANMTPAQAVSLWPQVVSIATTYNLKIVSPAMTYCSGGLCLSGYNTGFTSGTQWLDDFFSLCPTCQVDYIGLHVYDTWLYGFTGSIGNNTTGYKKYGKPIWVTEFDYSGSTSATQQASLMVDVIDNMEKDPSIFRYSWFMTRYTPANSTDVFTSTTGVLTSLGTIYTNMSSYDKNYYHTVNNIIEAEHYISKSVTYCNFVSGACTWPYSVLLETTTDASGILDAYNFASPTANANDTLFYNVNIPTSQTYTIDFRVNSNIASTISVRTYPGNVLLGTTTSLNTAGAWSTVTLAGINLTAGKQKIYFTAANGTPLKLNWFRINCASNCALPVSLTSFQAFALSSNSAKLEWETVSEKDNKEFVIERSTDGIYFDSMGTVPGSGTTSDLRKYSYIDTKISGSVIYYRLKQVDIDGTFSYSPVKVLSYNQNSIKLGQSSIITEFSSGRDVYFVVVSPLGELIQEGNYYANAGVTEKTVSLDGLAKGIYFIKIMSEDLSYSGKIINQ